MKPFLLLVGLLCISQTKAQSTEDSVKAVITKMFHAMQESDSASLISCFAPDAILQTIGRTKNGETKIATEKFSDFAASIARQPKGSLDERIIFETVKLDDNLALVWTPYSFYFNGKFSHCGVNSFQLVRFNGEWKIQYIIDTRRREPCIKAE